MKKRVFTLLLGVLTLVSMRLLPLLVIVAALSIPAYADTVFSNLGPNNQFVSAWNLGRGGIFSVAFTPSDNFTLTQIDVALLAYFGNSATLSLASSTSGGLPGAAIETFTLTGLPPVETTSTILPEHTVTPDMPVSLVSGTRYWLVAYPPVGASIAWGMSPSDRTSPWLVGSGTQSQSQAYLRPAYAVLGDPVPPIPTPEPASAATLFVALTGLALGYRKLESRRS